MSPDFCTGNSSVRSARGDWQVFGNPERSLRLMRRYRFWESFAARIIGECRDLESCLERIGRRSGARGSGGALTAEQGRPPPALRSLFKPDLRNREPERLPIRRGRKIFDNFSPVIPVFQNRGVEKVSG